MYVPIYRVGVNGAALSAFTSTAPTPATAPYRLVQNEVGAFSAAPPVTTIEGIPVARLAVSGGIGVAVWEALYPSSGEPVNIDFPVWVSPNGASGSSVVTAALDFGPVTTDVNRVPRFVATGLPLPLFRLTDPPAETPLPPSVLLALTGGAGLAVHQLRRRRNARAR